VSNGQYLLSHAYRGTHERCRLTAMKQAKPVPKPKKSNRGGARPGSGRPRTKIAKALLSNILIQELETLGDDLLPSIRELVRGIRVQQFDKHGHEIIFKQPPNATMIMYVADRLLGKMPSRTEITGGTDDDGNERPIPIRLLPPSA